MIYLPYIEIYVDVASTETLSDNGTVWLNDSMFSKDIIFSITGGGCVTTILIGGKIGIATKGDDAEVYCIPRITIAECGMDDPLPCPGESGFPPSVLYTYKGKKGDGYLTLEKYYMEINLEHLPKRMLYNSPVLKIKCTLFGGQSLMFTGLPRIFSSTYTDAEETIKVWEQRYITSTGEFGDKNPDGPESYNLRSYDRDLKNAGQYFPTGINSPNQDSVKMIDKMTMVGAGQQFQKDKDLSISKGNLKLIERDEQQKLYNDAYNRDEYDELTYNIIVPPNVQQFFDANNISSHGFGGVCEFISEKLSWYKHVNTISFNQDFDFWSPGGHYFVWDDKYYKTRCYILGPEETIYSPKVVHYKHGGADTVWDPLQTYVGWGKYEYYMGKLTQAKMLKKGIDTGYDWTGPAGGFVIETFQ